MKIFLVIITLLFAYILYISYPIYRAFKASMKIEEGTVAFKQHPENPTMKILVAGDSTAVGTGAKDNKESTAGRLGQDFPEADIVNIGENGLKLEGLNKKLDELETAHYDLVLLQIGANDIVGRTPYKEIEIEFSAVLNKTTALGTKVIVVTSGNIGLSPIFKFPLNTYISYRTVKVHNIFKKQIADQPSVSFVELYKEAKDDIFIKDISRYYASDLFHPSGDGYAVWYEGIKKVIY